MSGLAVPQRGLLTPQGVRPVPQVVAPLADAKREADKIFSQIGEARLAACTLFFNWVLIAKWIPEELGSLIASEDTKKEARWQNRVGLVLKKGPTAFLETDERHFHGCDVKVGDWVHYSAADGVEMAFRSLGNVGIGVICLRIEDSLIAGTIEHPDFLV